MVARCAASAAAQRLFWPALALLCAALPAAAVLPPKSTLRKSAISSDSADFLLKPRGGGARVRRRWVGAKGNDFGSDDEGRALECGQTEHVDATSDRSQRCPSACPFLAEDVASEGFCMFQCVKDWKHCKLLNPNATVADGDEGRCRGCRISGCMTCASDGTDTCVECHGGYWLSKDGRHCRTNFELVFPTILVLFGIIFVVLCAWALDMDCRPVTNEAGLKYGLYYRNRTKLHTKRAVDINPDSLPLSWRSKKRKLWPLSTNLLRTNVGGSGLLLFFNFQAIVIVWSLLVAAAWAAVAFALDPDMLWLGVQQAQSPRMYCHLIAWGHEKQELHFHHSLVFIFSVYLFSFFGVVAFSAFNLRRHQDMDSRETTMKDYVALASGLPQVSGKERVEEDLKELFSRETGQGVVGVVALWDQRGMANEILDAVDASIAAEQRRRRRRRSWISEEDEGRRRKGMLQQVERRLLQMYTEISEQTGPQTDINDILRVVHTSGHAFVVFNTEHERDRAVEAVSARGGIDCGGGHVAHLEETDAEPSTVMWQNFGYNQTWLTFYGNCAVAFAEILGALLVWILVFYTPYAWFALSFSYQNGAKPGLGTELSLTLVVVSGNFLMYNVCFDAAARLRLRFFDQMQATYVIMYFLACMLNVLLDLVVTFEIAHAMMVGEGLSTYDGTPLEEVTTFMQRFEAYSMQRELGNQLLHYAFPSTFFLPFVFEPFGMIFAPLWVMTRLIRTHHELKDSMIEQALVCMDMDLSRYADVLLNVGIAVLMFAFPMGFTVWTFLLLAFSHIYIYVYDHYRVLRAVKECEFAQRVVDNTTLLLLAIPGGMLLSILVLKSNCHRDMPCAEGPTLVARIVVAFFVHVVTHIGAIAYMVPRLFSRQEHQSSQVPYAQTAAMMPCTWFTQSLMYCLRSEHFYEHMPPCRHHVPGKEFLQEKNEEACCYYQEEGKPGSKVSEFYRESSCSSDEY